MAQQIHSLTGKHRPMRSKTSNKTTKKAPTVRLLAPKKPIAPPRQAPAVVTAPPEVEAPKGFTRDGKPRERAYRTYFGVTAAGRVMRYNDYEAREIDVRNGSVTRVTASEARDIEARGLRPSPLIHTTQWSPGASGTSQREVASAPNQSNGTSEGSSSRTVIEVQALLDNTMRTLAELQAKMSELDPDKR